MGWATASTASTNARDRLDAGHVHLNFVFDPVGVLGCDGDVLLIHALE
jgi:hypothetical protein